MIAAIRDVFEQPFEVTDPFNLAIARTVQHEAPTAPKTKAFIAASAKGAINRATWSVTFAKASANDPLATVLDTKTGETVRVHMPTTLVPPAGSGGTFDGNTIVLQPDGQTALEFYRLARSGTSWTCTRIVKQDLKGSSIKTGVRAAGICLGAGLIRDHELRAGFIPHALAMSLPKEMLKARPTPDDGQLMPSPDKSRAVWPANTQDTQAYVPYTGSIPMGSLFSIPPAVNVEALGLKPRGLALARALQQYGAYVVDQSSTIALYVEATAVGDSDAELRAAWRQLIPEMRRVTNNTVATPAGGSLSDDRVAPFALPVDWPAITRVRQDAPTVDFVYRGYVDRVIDGDTYDVWVDVGFSTRRLERLRLRGVNAPDDGAGKTATAFAERLLHPGAQVIIRTYKDRAETFGRFVADVWTVDGIDVAQTLLEQRVAEEVPD